MCALRIDPSTPKTLVYRALSSARLIRDENPLETADATAQRSTMVFQIQYRHARNEN